VNIDLLSTHDLLTLPPPDWLMAGLIPEEGFVGLYGPPESGKSFVALDWAMCISEGKAWLGTHAVKQSPVIYVAAEGGRGIQKRVAAWMRHFGKSDLPAMYWLLNPLYIREEGVVEDFLDELEHRDIWPGLMVLDTLSRCFGGGEENASADMGHFVQEMTRLAQGRRMASLVVHHTNAQGSRERGHGSLRGGTDTMFTCTSERGPSGLVERLTVVNDKQKDDARAPVIYVRPIEGITQSLVFEACEGPAPKTRGPAQPAFMRKVDMLRVLGSAENGFKFTEWRLACGGIPKQTFVRRVAQLIADGEIVKDEGQYSIAVAVTDIAELGRNEDE